MGIAKKYSKNDLARLYESSPIFKKYCQFNLWSEEFGEYDKVKYCETYLSKYIYAFTQLQLLQGFSPSFLVILHTSPSFMKFVKSGFIKYIDFHFLLFFQSNSFHYSNDSFEEIETFVEEYFQRYSRKVFEEDLLKCLLKSVNELVPNSIQGFMDSRLRFFYNQKLSAQITDRASWNLVMADNKLFTLKKSCGHEGLEDKVIIKDFYRSVTGLISSFSMAELFFISSLKFGNKTYKSLGVYKDPLSVAFIDFFNIVLSDTVHGWGLSFGSFNNNQFIFIESFIDRTSFIFNYFFKFNNPGYNAEIFYLLSRGYKWCFYTFLDVAYKPLNMPFFFGQDIKVFNKDVHTLLEFFVEEFDNFVTEDNDIDIPVHKNIILKGNFESCFLTASPLKFKNLLKLFDDSFIKYSNKSHINLLEDPFGGTSNPAVPVNTIKNLWIYFDKSYRDSLLDFHKNSEDLFVLSQKPCEEASLCLTDNFKGMRSESEDIFVDTFEAVSTFFGEVPLDTFENLEKILIKPYGCSPAVKKELVCLSQDYSEDTVDKWGLYSVKYINISKKLGFPVSDSLFSLTNKSIAYRYFYQNIKKISGWESSYLADCYFIWGTFNCDSKITFGKLDNLSEIKLIKV